MKSNLKSKIDHELLCHYLDGSLTNADETVLKNWLDADKRNRDRFDRLRKIWDTPEISLPLPDMEQAWKNIMDRIDAQEQATTKEVSFKLKIYNTPFIWHLFKTRIVPTAALMLILIGSAYLMLKRQQPVTMNEISVAITRQDTVALPDGTQLVLDAGSIFRYPEKFSEKDRTVYLQGEGYFEVVSDPDRPFIVHADGALIRVLGTEFNVRAWQQDRKVTVAVVRGTVALRAKENKDSGEEVRIRDSQFSILDETRRPSQPQYGDIAMYLSWMKREMYFQSTELHEVLYQLERWYDITFELPDQQAAANPVTLFIGNKPISELLDVIALINNFTYQQHGSKIIFSRKK